MSYGLLWIETVCLTLLWIATAVALAATIGKRSRGALVAFAMMVSGVCLAALVALTAVLKFGFLVEVNWFGYALSLFIASALGVTLLMISARRRAAPGVTPAGAFWPLGRLAIALAAVAAVTLMTLWNMDAEVRAEAANVRTEAGAMLIAVSPPEAEDDRNAAILYEKAFARLNGDATLNGRNSVFADEPPEPTSTAAKELLARHAIAIRQLRDATRLPACRFEHDYAHPSINMLLPELQSARIAANVLQLDARNAIATGRQRNAVDDVNAIFRLSRAVGGEPTLVSGLVGMGLDQLGVRTTEQILPALTRPEDLEALNLGDAASLRRTLRRCMQGEEAFGTSLFSDLAGGRISFQQIAGRTGASPDLTEFPPLPLLIRVFLIMPDMRAYRNYLDACLVRAADPYYRSQIVGGQEENLRAKRGGLLTSIIMPALNRVFGVEAEGEAAHAAAQVGVAVARYRLEHHAFPPSPDALVPQYLDEIPLDPFDGQPLRTRIKAGGYVIYSIGPDLKDDAAAHYDRKSKKGDLIFTIPAADQNTPGTSATRPTQNMNTSH